MPYSTLKWESPIGRAEATTGYHNSCTNQPFLSCSRRLLHLPRGRKICRIGKPSTRATDLRGLLGVPLLLVQLAWKAQAGSQGSRFFREHHRPVDANRKAELCVAAWCRDPTESSFAPFQGKCMAEGAVLAFRLPMCFVQMHHSKMGAEGGKQRLGAPVAIHASSVLLFALLAQVLQSSCDFTSPPTN